MSEPANSSPVFSAQPAGGASEAGGAGAQPAVASAPGASSAQQLGEMQFKSSDIGTVTARHEDLFKEHKARAAEKKARNDKLRRKLLIALGVVVAMMLVGLGVWWLVGVLGREKEAPTTPEEIQQTVTTTYDEAFDKAMDFSVDENNLSDIGPTDETINAATEVYNQAINDAGNNALLTNELRLSQMALYIMTGERYEEIVRIGSEINPDELSTSDRLKYYNYLAEAHWVLGNHDESKRYYKLIFELSGGEEYGG